MTSVSDCGILAHLPSESIWPDLGLCDVLAALRCLWSPRDASALCKCTGTFIQWNRLEMVPNIFIQKNGYKEQKYEVSTNICICICIYILEYEYMGIPACLWQIIDGISWCLLLRKIQLYLSFMPLIFASDMINNELWKKLCGHFTYSTMWKKGVFLKEATSLKVVC